MSVRTSRIILAILLALSLSFSTAFAETDGPAPDSQTGSPGAVASSDTSVDLPQDQADPDIPESDDDEVAADQQEEDAEQELGQEQDPVPTEDVPSEESLLRMQELPQDPESLSMTETPPQQEEESEPVYEIRSIDGVLYYVDIVTGEKYSGKGLISYTDGKLYYVLEGGKIAVNRTVTADGRNYHTGAGGAVIKGLHRWGDNYYYSDNEGVLKTSSGFVRVNGSRYYVRSGGKIAADRIVTVNGSKYHAGKEGVIRTGVHKWKGKYYYSGPKTGKLRKKAGFVKYNGSLYYIRKGGVITVRKVFSVRGKTYRARSNGKLATGVHRIGKQYYFFSPKTGEWIRQERFRKWKKDLYYIQADGTLAAGKVFVSKNLAYYADKKCRVKKLKVINPTGSSVLKVAQSQVGIMTGEKYWGWFFGTRFVDTDITPWCGTFVGWCYDQAGAYGRISSAGNIAYVPCYTWFADRNGCWVTKTAAKAGDIVVFGRDRHVGIVERIYKGYLITIEGNSGPTAAYGCGLPGAVTRKVYSIHDGDIKGIIHP